MTRAFRNAALDYADRGWHVLPLRPRGKEPLGRLVHHGKDDATADLPTVLRWWTAEPRANVGIVAGPSGLLILDVDPRNGGDDHLHDLERELGPLPETVRAQTGGGGEHYLFRHPGGILVGKLAPRGVPLKDAGVDVQDHKYIVAAPSIHPSGNPYEWDLAPGDVPVADLPPSWEERLRPAASMTLDPDRRLRTDHDDPLRRIPAVTYVGRLTGRTPARGGSWACCPFHNGGQEKAPSLKLDGPLWSCFGCPAPAGKRAAGGNIYEFGAYLWGYALPLRGADFLEVKAQLQAACG